jgi:hypothetical protein
MSFVPTLFLITIALNKFLLYFKKNHFLDLPVIMAKLGFLGNFGTIDHNLCRWTWFNSNIAIFVGNLTMVLLYAEML